MKEKGPARLLDVPHPEAPLIVHVPNLEALLLGADAFAHRATQKAAGALLERFQKGLEQQIGLNPFAPGAAARVGIDAKQGAVMFLEPGHDEPIVALALTDRKTADAALKGLMEKLDGANKEEHWAVAEREATTLGRPFGDKLVPVVHWLHLGDVALVVRGGGKEALAAAVQRLEHALRTEGVPAPSPLERLGAKVPVGQVYSYTRGLAQAAGAPPAETMSRFQVAAGGFESDTYVALAVPGLKEALGATVPLELARTVEPGASAVLLTGSARPEGLQALRNLPELTGFVDAQSGRIARLVGLDIEKEALPLFAGPLAVAVHLDDVGSIPERIQKRRFSTLMDVVQVGIVAELKDPAAMLAVLHRAKDALTEQGVKLRARKAKLSGKATIIFEPDTDKPKIGWTVVDGRYVYAAGPGRLDKLLAHLRAPGDGMLPELQKGIGAALAQTPGASVVVLRGESIAAAASQLQLKRGFGIGELVDAAAALVRTLGDVAMSITAEPDGLRVQVREALQ